jgi:probable O-glycosylation ligase (exosortase A-associated)
VLSLLVLSAYLVSSKYKSKFKFWPIEAWLMLTMLIGLSLSTLNAYDSKSAWIGVNDFLKFFIFFMLMINIIDRHEKVKMFYNVMIINAAWLVYRCWDLRGTTGARFENRGGGVVNDANQFAAALILLLPIVLNKAFENVKWYYRVGSIIGVFGIIMSVTITGSRGGFLALIVCGISSLYYHKKYRKKIIAYVIVLVFSISPFISDYYLNRITSLTTKNNEMMDQSSKGRLDAWKLAIDIWKKEPLLGCGVKNFGYYMAYEVEGLNWGERGHVAHSLWFQTLAEGGSVVFGALLAMLIFFFIRIHRIKRGLKEDCEVRNELNGLQVGMLSFLVAASFVDRLFYEPLYWWCGIAAIYWRQGFIPDDQLKDSTYSRGA